MGNTMTKRTKRVYVDSSALGGKFNRRIAEQTRPFWDAVERGEFIIIVSSVLEDEVMDEKTPQRAKDFLAILLESQAVRVSIDKESNDLADRYIAANVVDECSLNDCRHVALATLAHADVIVSWNLQHMVEQSEGYKNVNRVLGYPEIEILTPEKFMEVQHDET